MSVCVGDIIDLSFCDRFNKLAKVIEIKKGKVEAIDLSCGGIVVFSENSLFDKQEITGNRLKPSEEKELDLLGAKNIWISLTPESYKKHIDQKNKKEILDIKEKQIEENQLKFLKNMFLSDCEKKEIEYEKLNIFSDPKTDESQKTISPLSKFMKRKI
jgi:hypothetical protein